MTCACDWKMLWRPPMNIRVQRNLVLLEPLKKRDRSPGGIFYDMPRRDDEKQWRVLACGPGKTVRNPRTKRTHFDPMEVQPGDRVLVEVALGNKLVFPDGRRIVDAGQILMKW